MGDYLKNKLVRAVSEKKKRIKGPNFHVVVKTVNLVGSRRRYVKYRKDAGYKACSIDLIHKWRPIIYPMNEGVVSKETVVLRRWGSSIQKFGFINGVDNVNWPPYRDSKS